MTWNIISFISKLITYKKLICCRLKYFLFATKSPFTLCLCYLVQYYVTSVALSSFFSKFNLFVFAILKRSIMYQSNDLLLRRLFPSTTLHLHSRGKSFHPFSCCIGENPTMFSNSSGVKTDLS